MAVKRWLAATWRSIWSKASIVFNRGRVVGEWCGRKVVNKIVGSVAVGELIDGNGVAWSNVVIKLIAGAVVG